MTGIKNQNSPKIKIGKYIKSKLDEKIFEFNLQDLVEVSGIQTEYDFHKTMLEQEFAPYFRYKRDKNIYVVDLTIFESDSDPKESFIESFNEIMVILEKEVKKSGNERQR